MEKTENQGKNKCLLWTARIWSIPLTIYALIFAIGYLSNWIRFGVADPYAVEDYPFIENLPPVFLFFAIVGLVIAWKWQKIGGIINIIFSAATLVVLLIQLLTAFDLIYVIPFILLLIVTMPGILFLLHYYKNK